MSLLAFLAACGIGAAACLVARPSARIGKFAGIVGLLAAFVAALFIGPTTRLAAGDVTLSGSAYAGLFLACVAGSGLLLCVVSLASGWPEELAPAALASFAGLAVAFTAAEPGVALSAGAAASTAGALVIVRASPRRPEEDGRLSEIRVIGIVTAGLLLAVIALLRPPWNGTTETPVFVLAFFGLAVALAVRSGAVPFHIPAVRLGRSATAVAPALLLVWLPAGLGILALSWSASTFGIRSDWLTGGVAVVQAVAVATIVLGALAALVHDELDQVVAYSIVSDAGFILLALAAQTDAAAGPARLWLLAFVAAKTGLVAWSAAVGRAFGASSVGRLRGWLRRTPLLGLALVMIAVATLGWPGSPVYQARSTLIQLALPGWLELLFAAAIVLSIAYYGRLLAMGLLPPTEDVRAASGELPRWPAGSAEATMGTPAGKVADMGEPAVAIGGAASEVGPDSTGDDAGSPKPTKPKRRNARAAAAAAAASPTQVEAADSSETIGAGTGIPSPEPGPGLGRKLAAAWRLNRPIEVSLIVLGGAALAAALAFGGFGARAASQSGIPLDAAAHASPAPTAPPTPSPTPTAAPTAAPTPAPAPSASPGASGSAGASATPAS